MSTAPTRPQTHGIGQCMCFWFSASERALDQAHNPRASSAERLEAFRFASRAEARGNRLAQMLRTGTTDRWVREAA